MKQTGLNSLMNNVGLGLITFLSVPIIILNYASWFIGGLWILFSGGWKLIVLSILVAMAMPYVYSLVALPSMGLGLLAVKAAEKKWYLISFILFAVSTFYEKLLIMIWINIVFGYFLPYANTYNVLPLLLLGYSTAVTSLTSMASKEERNSFGTWFTVFFAQIVFIVDAILILTKVSEVTFLLVPWSIFLVFWIIQMFVVNKAVKDMNVIHSEGYDQVSDEEQPIDITNEPQIVDTQTELDTTDVIYPEVVKFVLKSKREINEQVLQKKFGVGYARAARLKNLLIRDHFVKESLGNN